MYIWFLNMKHHHHHQFCPIFEGCRVINIRISQTTFYVVSMLIFFGYFIHASAFFLAIPRSPSLDPVKCRMFPLPADCTYCYSVVDQLIRNLHGTFGNWLLVWDVWYTMDSTSCMAVEVSKNRKLINGSERTTMPEDGLIDGQTGPEVMLHLADGCWHLARDFSFWSTINYPAAHQWDFLVHFLLPVALVNFFLIVQGN